MSRRFARIQPANQMTIAIAVILCYLLASAFFLLCVMLTARGKEYGSRVTAPSKHSGALSSCATMPPTFMRRKLGDLIPVVFVPEQAVSSRHVSPDWLRHALRTARRSFFGFGRRRSA